MLNMFISISSLVITLGGIFYCALVLTKDRKKAKIA